MSFTNTGQMTTETFDEITALMAAEDRGENPFNLKHRTPEQIAADNDRHTRSQAITTPVKAGSKKDMAIAVYVGLEDKSRKAVIEALIAEGFNPATASTYQHSLKKWVDI